MDNNIEIRATQNYIYKVCINPKVKDEYLMYFTDEYNKMREMQMKSGEAYHRLFPKYYKVAIQNENPFICMEHINGFTLEEWLSRQNAANDPYKYLTRSQLLNLFNQLNEAEQLLLNAGMLQLDLNPSNIIVVNDQNFNVKLVDFTDPFYISEEIRLRRMRFNRSHKIIEFLRHNPNFDHYPSLQLREMGQLLFTRLFYNGTEAYERLYTSRNCFFNDYSTLFNSFYPGTIDYATIPDNDYLYYWNLWIQELIRKLEKHY